MYIRFRDQVASLQEERPTAIPSKPPYAAKAEGNVCCVNCFTLNLPPIWQSYRWGHPVMKPKTLDAARTHHSLPAMQPGTGRLQGTFHLDEGPVTLIAPAALSQGSCTALADFFELFLRRAKSAAPTPGLFPLGRKMVSG